MPASETIRRVSRLSSQRLIATAEVYSDSDSRVTTLRPPCDSRISPASASSTSTQMPRRIASSAMIRAYGFRSSTVSGGWVNSGSLMAFLRLTAITGTRLNPSFSYSPIAAWLSWVTDRSM